MCRAAYIHIIILNPNGVSGPIFKLESFDKLSAREKVIHEEASAIISTLEIKNFTNSGITRVRNLLFFSCE